MFRITFLLLLVAVVLPAQTHTYDWDDTLCAIRKVETGGLPNEGRGAKGDNGNAFGPYQIWKNYWIDSKIKGSHARCLKDKKYSEAVVAGYMKRYAKNEYWRLRMGKGSISDVEKIARIHNGGPRGHKKKATIRYWKKVRFNIVPKHRRR